MVAIDVYYKDDGTFRAAGVIFQDWRQENPDKIIIIKGKTSEEYIPGEFYRRELPCILDILKECPEEKTVIIDGFIDLKRGNKVIGGLGHHLLEEKPDLSVIGVAKSKFAQNQDISEAVYRGGSKKPLWVQGCAGVVIREMHGPYRIPTLLKTLDQITKGKWKN